jgi:hypothetical protein
MCIVSYDMEIEVQSDWKTSVHAGGIQTDYQQAVNSDTDTQ